MIYFMGARRCWDLLDPLTVSTDGEIGYTAWRDRVLTPVTTMQLFLLQILHGRTACSHLPHLSGLWASAAAYCQARARIPLWLLVRASVHALLRVGARQIVDFTPGRPFVMPGVRRTPAVKGLPRFRWLTALSVHDHLLAWYTPKTRPTSLMRETLAALPDALVLREVGYHLGTPGFQTCQIALVTTLLDAEVLGDQ
jgi:hypothetical protein